MSRKENQTIRNSKKKEGLRILVAALLFLALWQIGAMAVNVAFLLPTPLSAFQSLLALLKTPEFYVSCAATLSRCLTGIGLSFVSGVATAALSYAFPMARAILLLPVSFLKSVPVIAVILYALLLLTSSNVPIFVCFLMCYPVVYTNLLSGLDNMDEHILEMARIYRLSPALRFKYIFLPSLVPQIKASLSLIAGLSWKAVVAAEVLSVPKHSMGYNLLNSKIYFETDQLFAWIIAIVILSLAFEHFIKALMRKITLRQYQGSKILKSAVKFETSENVEICRISPIDDKPSDQIPVHLSHITKRFESTPVLEDFSAVFPSGKITAIMGPSGLGKTTLLRLLCGLETPDSGQITGVSAGQISYLFQEDRLLPWLNVYDNIALVNNSGQSRSPQADNQKNQVIKKILSDLELSESIYKMPDQLSGGMQRRVALGRALFAPSDLLLLDEPFKGLDHALAQRIAERLVSACCNKTVLLVTHSEKEADALADHICRLT